MGILGIIFNQQKVVIGANSVANGLFGSIASQLSNVVQQQLLNSSTGVCTVDATTDESHDSPCEVTEFPIEQDPNQNGPAVINDHVQLKPKKLSIKGTISDTPLGFLLYGNIANIINAGAALFGGGRAIENYKALQTLQDSKQPFTVITNLKRYQNMIMLNLHVDRTAETANCIAFTCDFKQVYFVATQTVANLNLAPSASTIGQGNVNQGQNTTVPETTENTEGEKKGSLLSKVGF